MEADALARLASAKDADQLKFIPVETLNSLSIQTKEPMIINCTIAKDNWMTSIIQYLKDGVLPEDKKKARLLRLKLCATGYTTINSTREDSRPWS